MTQHIIALLPLKAHSSRVPGKNFRVFNGRPLVHWILESLLSIDLVDKVVINTDARPELSDINVVDSDRVMIRDRRSEICGDEVSMNKILADDIEAIDSVIYLMTHTTNPLLSCKTIKRALDCFQRSITNDGIDSLFTVNKHQSRFYHADGRPVNHDPDNLIPTQDLEPWFEENSNLYLFTRESFRTTNARIGRNPMMFEIPKIESLDIDTQDDWDLAEAVAKSVRFTSSVAV